jgi:type I restriction enzyme S subunit
MKAGWKIERLDDVCDLITCGVAARPKYVAVGVPFLSAKNVKDGNIIWSGYNCVSKKTHDELTKNNKPIKGDILYTRVGSFGEAAVIEKETEFSVFVSLTLIKPKKHLLNNYFLKYYLNSSEVKELAKRSINSLGVGNLNVGTVREFPIHFPTLPEQQRIVGILDEAFENIAIAKANAEKNLQNARALFDSHLNSVFTQRGERWVEKTLGNVFTTATGTTPPKNNADFYGDFMPLVKPPELCDAPFDAAPDGLSEVGAAVARTLPAKSILVSCIGNLGKIGLNTVPVAFNQQINAILPDESQAIPEFMFFQALSSTFNEQLESLASGTTVPIVNKSKFNSVKIVLPPLPIQKAIVTQLGSLREETQTLESIYKQKLAALDALKKSLLHQAFTGEL